MSITTAGRDHICGAIIGESLTAFNNANAYLSVGDSSTAFAAAQTDLQASTNKLRKAMDATFPTRSTNVLTWKATFGTSDANWVWAEWGIHNASSAGTMLSRKVDALGTKTAAGIWVLTATMTTTIA